MSSYPIPREVSARAFRIAQEREAIAESYGKPTHFNAGEGYGDTEINWQGTIGELMMLRIFPSLTLAQPLVVDSPEISRTDFLTPSGRRIEVKCNRFLREYTHYFVNVYAFSKKPCDYLVCTCINNHPSKATVFTILGYLKSSRVPAYPVNDSFADPAYAVPVADINPHIEKLFLECCCMGVSS